MPTEIVHTNRQMQDFITKSHRPVFNERGLAVNSVLTRREWETLDATIIAMVKLRLNAVADLQAAGLTSTTTLAEMSSLWRVASERTRPNVSMDGRTRGEQDRTDRVEQSIPIPIIHADYEIGRRELESSRRLGADLSVFEAQEAAISVAEETERQLFLGNTTIVIGGNDIPGLTTFGARDTATAAAYGGGDFGTIANIQPTLLGMFTALSNVRYHGPFNFYISNTQYVEMMATYTDGSGDTGITRALRLPWLNNIKPSDFLVAGNGILLQMTSNVVDLRMALPLTNREWDTPDGQATMWKVMVSMTGRLKSDYDGNAGIAHVTAA